MTMSTSELEIDIENDSVNNFYGSELNESTSSSSETSSLSEDEHTPTASVSVSCSCKNTCSRKTTQRSAGCPCKTANAKCSQRCKCGSNRVSCKKREELSEEVRTVAANNPPEPPENNPADRVICTCKNTCSRKRSERSAGCPCKTAGLECCQSCKCGTAKSQCKNISVHEVINRNPSAFARHQEQVERAETEIMEFVQHLTAQDKDTLLVKLMAKGRGSVEFARDVLSGEIQQPVPFPGQPDPSQPVAIASHPQWCICGVCRTMPLDMENKCCGKRTCVTCYEMFTNICIDREVLTLAIRARFDIMAEEADYSANSFRKASYRQYCLWKYGKLGRGNRRVLPSCVVIMIREAYPSADGLYMGYRES